MCSSRSSSASTSRSSSPTTSPGSRRPLDEGRRRRAPGAHVHRLREPAERRLHVHRRRHARGNAAADFLLGLPQPVPAHDRQRHPGRHGWLYAGYVQDEFRPWPQPDAERRRCATSWRCRSSTRTTRSTRSVPASSRRASRQAPTGLVYPGDDGRAARHLRDRQEQHRAARRAGLGPDRATAARACAAAWGIFYDALAGQGDFFQNGVLAPPFTPLLEVNAPPAPLTLRNPLSGVSGGADRLPAGPDLHRLGRAIS